MEAAVWDEESVGGEDVEVGVEDEVIAEGVDGGDGSEFAIVIICVCNYFRIELKPDIDKP